MIEDDVFPAARRVACIAFLPVGPFVSIVLLVAGGAISGSERFADGNLMASFTRDAAMPFRERISSGYIVVERRTAPVQFEMAGFALAAEYAAMTVVSCVARVAVEGSRLVPLVGVAPGAGRDKMRAVQRESGFAMIEGRRVLPALFGMALLTGTPESAAMLVVLLMAGVADRQRLFF